VIGIFRSHSSDDLFSRRERLCCCCEILDIGTGAVENLLCFVIAGFGFFVTGDDNSGMKTLDDTNARDPLVTLGRASESEHLVDLIVSDVAGHDGIERRDVEHGTARDIAVADLNHTQFVPFKVDDVTIERRRPRGGLRDGVAKVRRKQLRITLDMGIDVVDDARGSRTAVALQGTALLLHQLGEALQVFAGCIGDSPVFHSRVSPVENVVAFAGFEFRG
jgi:hypothetical protein